MMVKREVIEKAGMMPEIFFLYYEELDWCTHITRVATSYGMNPVARFFTKKARAQGNECAPHLLLTRNRLLYAWRNLTEADAFSL
jgi:GT2 family glycosyltransferase